MEKKQIENDVNATPKSSSFNKTIKFVDRRIKRVKFQKN